jgi:hypothetical protein
MDNFLEELKKYFKETPKDKILEDWSKSEEFDNVGPTVEEFLGDDWVNIEYVGEDYEMEGVIFKKGTLSGLPKDIWESQRDCETMKNWKVI